MGKGIKTTRPQSSELLTIICFRRYAKEERFYSQLNP